MSIKSSPFSKIDHAIVVLSYIYNISQTQFNQIISKLSLTPSQKNRILERVSESTIYSKDQIDRALKLFYNELSMTNIVSHQAITSISRSLDQNSAIGNEKNSILDSCAAEELTNYLDSHSSLLIGLVCHGIGNYQFNKIISTLPPEKMITYLINFSEISPVSTRYLQQFAQFIYKRINTKRKNDIETEKFYRLVSVVELMTKSLFNSIKTQYPQFKLLKIIEPYCLKIEDIKQFSTEDRKCILDSLEEKELLIPVLAELPSQITDNLLLTFTKRKQEIFNEALRSYKSTPNIKFTQKPSVIRLIRQLQRSGQINPELKNCLHADSVSLHLNLLNSDTIRSQLETIQSSIPNTEKE